MNKKTIIIILLTILIIFVIFFPLQTLCENFYLINDKKELSEVDIMNSEYKPLVVLYSCLNRYWDKTIDNHIEVIKKITNNDLSNVLIGIHYWKDPSIEIPNSIKNMNYKSSSSENIIADNKLIYSKNETFNNGVLTIKRFIFSIKNALENAEILYYEKYKHEMPIEQPILRFRYDSYVHDIAKFPYPLNNEDNYYLSTWNTDHRGYNNNRIEIADAVLITTKKVLMNLIKIDVDKFINDNIDILNPDSHFHESLLYFILEKTGVKIVFDFNLHLSLIRKDDKITNLSYNNYR